MVVRRCTATEYGGYPASSRFILLPKTCPYRKLRPIILIVKSTEDPSCGGRAKPLNRTTERGVLAEGEMRPDVIIIGGIVLTEYSIRAGVRSEIR